MKLLLSKLLLFSPLLLGIVATNYLIDPANIFHSHQMGNDSITYEQNIVNYLMKGYNVANLESYDERIFQEKFIASLKTSPEIVVLGSSRAQLIGNDFFNGKMVINNSITGAAIEDYLAIYNLYDKRSIKPQQLIIELPPWLLNDNNDQTRWKSLEADYDQMIHKLDSGKISNNLFAGVSPKYFELVSFEYFQQSLKAFYTKTHDAQYIFKEVDFKGGYALKSLYNQLKTEGYTMSLGMDDTLDFFNSILRMPDFYEGWSKRHADIILTEDDESLVSETRGYRKLPFSEQPLMAQENIIKLNRSLLEATFYETCPPGIESSSYPTLQINNSGLTRLVDGTISYQKAFREQSNEEIEIAAKSFINTHTIFGLKNFNRISQESLLMLSGFVDYLRKNNIKVIFVLMPYHPIVYSYFSSNREYAQVLESESVYRNLAQKKNITIVGGYNPARQNIDSSYFYDGMHLKMPGLTKVIKSFN